MQSKNALQRHITEVEDKVKEISNDLNIEMKNLQKMMDVEGMKREMNVKNYISLFNIQTAINQKDYKNAFSLMDNLPYFRR